MSWREINHSLKKMDNQQIVSIIKDLYVLNKINKTFLSTKLLPTSFDKILEESKKTIENQFFPKRGYGKCNLAVVKKVISDYKAITKDTFGCLDLMLTYVEQGTDFVNQYGDIQENAYSSMESVFEKFSGIIKKKENIPSFEAFRIRIEDLEKNVQGIGYGFGDHMSWIIDELLQFFKDRE